VGHLSIGGGLSKSAAEGVGRMWDARTARIACVLVPSQLPDQLNKVHRLRELDELVQMQVKRGQ